LLGIKVNGQVFNRDFRKEAIDRSRRIAPGRNGDHLKIIAAKFALKRIKLGHLFAARRAPRRPEIRQNPTPFEILKAMRAALKRAKLRRRNRLGRTDKDELFHRIFAQSL
jgi:hypothetical protein